MPDANDPQVGNTSSETERRNLPFSARRFARGLSHDVGRRGRIKIQHIVAAIIVVVGGIWGALATGLFASPAVNAAGTGLFYGNPGQLGVQALSILGTAVFSAVMTLVVIGLTRLITGPLRIDKDNEIIGLDNAFHGEHAFDIQG